MSDEPIATPKRRGRPPNNKMAQVMKEIDKAGLYDKGLPRETPTIKEGAHWQVGVPEDEQVEAVKRHNEQLATPQEIDRMIEHTEQHFQEVSKPQVNAAIQIMDGPNKGVICQVGQIEEGSYRCFQILSGGEKAYYDVKEGEFMLLTQPVKGMIAHKMPERGAAPNWREPRVVVPQSK